jgi:hypothetical protein
LNKTRMNFLEEFQRMIDEYNSGAANIETFFAHLMAFTQKLSEEDKRAISEELTEEELTIFDLLTKPEVALSKAEEREVKKVAKELLVKLKREKLVLDWKKSKRHGQRCGTPLKPYWMSCRGNIPLNFTTRSAMSCTNMCSMLTQEMETGCTPEPASPLTDAY